MDNTKLNLCFFFLLSLLVTSALCEPQVPCLFIFGDSLVDNGNNNHRNTTAKVDFYPYGIDFPDGPTGRFTNGRNTVDIIAEMLGFEKYIAPFVNATDEEILRGLNYGSGGAGILDETGTIFGDVINLDEQLSNHENTLSRVTELLGSESAAKHYLSGCLYSVGMGNNDYLANYLPQLHSSATQYSADQFAQLLINQYSNQLTRLYDNGARKVLVTGLGKLGCVPQQIATYGATAGSDCVETSNEPVQIFNQNLKLLLAHLNTRLPGATFVYTTDSSTATSYGGIKNMIDPCCGVSTGTGQCLPGNVPCSNRDEYLFWDLFHPTEAANLISARIAYDDMSQLLADPVNIATW